MREELAGREPKHIQLVKAMCFLGDALGDLRELVCKVHGDKKVVEAEIKGPPAPAPSLAEVLETVPTQIRSMTEELQKIKAELVEALF